jgi:hypothetical protein
MVFLFLPSSLMSFLEVLLDPRILFTYFWVAVFGVITFAIVRWNTPPMDRPADHKHI